MVQDIPLRPGLVVSSPPGVMIAKAVYDRVPERPMFPDQRCFNGHNEVRFHLLQDYESAAEITDFQVLGLLDVPRVLSQSAVQ